jgi:GMP synthase (glutamine-hydrolysing)
LKNPCILILDFGGQYTQLICRRIRDLGVYSEIRPFDISAHDLRAEKPRGIILSGGPESVLAEGAPKPDQGILDLGIPILGICYGMQWIHQSLGGAFLPPGSRGEYGATDLEVNPESDLFAGMTSTLSVWMSHGDCVDENQVGHTGRVVAKTGSHVAGLQWDSNQAYGVQFHPEVSHCEGGQQILQNFLKGICGCERDWTMSGFLEQTRLSIQGSVGDRKVLSFVSGGVDSTFVTVLLGKTPGIEVHAVYIDALMRKGETEEVISSLKEAGIENLLVMRARDRFIETLESIQEPEAKRKAVGELFGTLQQEACETLGLDPEVTVLAQGTLYTDLIESGEGIGKKAHTIKSHHNVGCEFIEKLKQRGQIVEPARWIFKDEVRKAAAELGLPRSIVERQPFPGPGMAIRIVSSNPDWLTEEYFKENERLRAYCSERGMEGSLLPVKTVGVQGDSRTYRFAALLRGEDDWTKIRSLAAQVPSDFDCVNRIVLDLGEAGSREISAAAKTETKVDRKNLELLEEIDFFGRGFLRDKGFEKNISQTIFVLFGADPYEKSLPSVALRAVKTLDFMTVTPVSVCQEREMGEISDGQVTWESLRELGKEILDRFEVGCFVLDVTDKPPATTCWE